MIEILLKNAVYDICIDAFYLSFVKKMVSPNIASKFQAGRLYKRMEYYCFEYDAVEKCWIYELMNSRNVYLKQIMPGRVMLFKVNGNFVEIDEDEIIFLE